MRKTELQDFDVWCPYCHRRVIRAISSAEEIPHKGDFAFCPGCGNVSVFSDRNMRRKGICLRKPKIDERFAISCNHILQARRQQWVDGAIRCQ